MSETTHLWSVETMLRQRTSFTGRLIQLFFVIRLMISDPSVFVLNVTLYMEKGLVTSSIRKRTSQIIRQKIIRDISVLKQCPFLRSLVLQNNDHSPFPHMHLCSILE